MSFAEGLRRGTQDLQWDLPQDWEIESWVGGFKAIDAAGPCLWFGYCEQSSLELDDAHWPMLQADLAADTLRLYRRIGVRRGHKAEDLQPDYSALVSASRVDVSGRQSLEVIHRSEQEWGREAVFGQLLIPMSWGVFVVRLFSSNGMTGLRTGDREADITIETMLSDPAANVTQAMTDDPRYDERFPMNPLAIVRRSLVRLRNEGAIKIGGQPPKATQSPLDVPGVGRIALPPRFSMVPHTKGEARFHRISYAASEAVRELTVGLLGDSLPPRERTAEALAKVAQRVDRERLPEGPQNLQRRAGPANPDPRWLLCQITETTWDFAGATEPFFRACRYVLRADGKIVVFRITTNAELRAEAKQQLLSTVLSWVPSP